MAQRSALLARVYRAAALMTLNTLLLFVAANVVVGLALLVRDHVGQPPAQIDQRLSRYRGRFVDFEAYTAMSREEVETFLDEQDAKGSLGFRFDPWRQFREPTYSGRLLNTDEQGFRRTRAPRPGAGQPHQVFVFGGSTTFGYGVSDEHTAPSHLQSALESLHPDRSFRVRNLGQGFFYSSQTLALLAQLLRSGEVPHYAIFIDGGNDVAQLGYLRDHPRFTPALEQMWDARSRPPERTALPDVSWIPLVRVAQGLARRAGLFPAAPVEDLAPAGGEDTTQAQVAARVDYVASRYIANVRLRRGICREYGIRCLFVWQPHVVYKYDRSLHRNFPFQGAIPPYYGAVWARMEQARDPDFLNLGAMFEGVTEKVFVDDVHYNEATNRRLAERVAAAMAVGSPSWPVPEKR